MTSVYVKNPEDIKLVEEVVFDRLYWDKLDAGTITDDEVKEEIRSRLPQRLWESSCAVYVIGIEIYRSLTVCLNF